MHYWQFFQLLAAMDSLYIKLISDEYYCLGISISIRSVTLVKWAQAYDGKWWEGINRMQLKAMKR